MKGGIGILGVSEFMGNDRYKGTLEQLNFLTEHFKTPVILEDITQSLVMQYIEVTEGRPLRDIESFYKRNVKKRSLSTGIGASAENVGKIFGRDSNNVI